MEAHATSRFTFKDHTDERLKFLIDKLYKQQQQQTFRKFTKKEII